MMTNSIKPGDNMDDINSYVEQEVRKSEALQIYPKRAGLEPVTWFKDNANSIFIRVVIALEQLQTTDASWNSFEQSLTEFATAPGMIEPLDESVFTRIEENRRWVQEILR